MVIGHVKYYLTLFQTRSTSRGKVLASWTVLAENEDAIQNANQILPKPCNPVLHSDPDTFLECIAGKTLLHDGHCTIQQGSAEQKGHIAQWHADTNCTLQFVAPSVSWKYPALQYYSASQNSLTMYESATMHSALPACG